MSKKGIVFGAAIFLGTLLVIFILQWRTRIRAAAAANECIRNLQLIQGAKDAWAMENRKGSNAVPTADDILYYVESDYPPQFPRCPLGGVYTIGRIGEPAKCSIPLHDIDLAPVEVRCVDAEDFVQPEPVFHDAIAGAKVVVIDDSGRRLSARTDQSGSVTIPTWPHRAVAIILSKEGYLTFSNAYPVPAINLMYEGKITLHQLSHQK